MFAGNTDDASTLRADLSGRFAVGRICVIADRGLVSLDNLQAVAGAGFDHVLAARLRRDRVSREALEAIDDDTAWIEISQHRCRAADSFPVVRLANGVTDYGRLRRSLGRTLTAGVGDQPRPVVRRLLKDPRPTARSRRRHLAA